MTTSISESLAFYLLAALTVAGAGMVAFSRNILHSAFALLAAFLGVAGLYVLLAADLLAVVQLLVYAGGVLVLILFAVMLTARIDAANVSNPTLGVAGGLLALVAVCGPMAWVAWNFEWPERIAAVEPTTARIGAALLGPYVLPFEIVSVLLVAALVGAVTLARGPVDRKGIPASSASNLTAEAGNASGIDSEEPAADSEEEAEADAAEASGNADPADKPSEDSGEATSDGAEPKEAK